MANMLRVYGSLITSRIKLRNWLRVLRKMPLLRFRQAARKIRMLMHRGELRVTEVVAVHEDGCPRKIRILKVLPRPGLFDL